MPAVTRLPNWDTHVKGDAAYVNEKYRVCQGCPEESNVKPLSQFYRHPNKLELYAKLCLDCERARVKGINDKKQNEILTEISKTIADRRFLKQASLPSLESVASMVADATGSMNDACDLIGQVYKKVLTDATKADAKGAMLDRAITVGKSLISTVAMVEKNRPPQLDLTDLSEEEVGDLVFQMVMSNQHLRKRLAANIEFRREIMQEAGLTTVELNGLMNEFEDETE